MKLFALLAALLLGIPVVAQTTHRYSPIELVVTDPTGTACSTTHFEEYNNSVFSCISSTWQNLSSLTAHSNQSYAYPGAGVLTWTNPALNQSASDTTSTVQTSSAQGDQYVTPITRIVSSDAGVNDDAPLYAYHNCNWTGALSSAPCVGAFVVSQNNSGDTHNGVWAMNPIAIQYSHSTHALTYGIETNVFNQSGFDAGSPSTPSASQSFIFGYAATMGGGSGANGSAAYLVTDTNLGAYWWDGLWVQRALYAALEAGPIGGGSNTAWAVVSNPQGQASNTTNFGSIPSSDIESFWTGSISTLQVLKRQYVPNAGNNPIGCYNYTFSVNLRQQFCDDGSNVFLPGPNAQGLRVTPDADGETTAAFAATNHANNAFNFVVQKNGLVSAVGPYQVSGNTVLPTNLTGDHGNSTKVQISDGTGTSGNVAKFDANGNVTDGGTAGEVCTYGAISYCTTVSATGTHVHAWGVTTAAGDTNTHVITVTGVNISANCTAVATTASGSVPIYDSVGIICSTGSPATFTYQASNAGITTFGWIIDGKQ